MLAVAAGSLAALLAVRKRVAVSSLAAGVYPSLACSRETFLLTYKYYLHTHVQATDSRLYVYIYIYIELARDDCRTLAARAAAPIKTPLLEALSSLSPLLRSPRPSDERAPATGNQQRRGREASVLLPCVLAPASPVSFSRAGRGPRSDV